MEFSYVADVRGNTGLLDSQGIGIFGSGSGRTGKFIREKMGNIFPGTFSKTL